MRRAVNCRESQLNVNALAAKSRLGSGHLFLYCHYINAAVLRAKYMYVYVFKNLVTIFAALGVDA